MSNLLEDIQEVRNELDGLFSGMHANGVLTKEDNQVIESVERKIASVQTEVSRFFSGKI